MNKPASHNVFAASPGDGADKAGALASALFRQATLSGATELARAGRYGEAERLLAELDVSGEADPAGLDLRARICSQQGRLGEARQYWERAQRLDGSNPAYGASIQRIAALQKRPFSVLFAWPVVLSLVAVLLVVGVQLSLNHKIEGLQQAASANIDRLTTGQQAITEKIAAHDLPRLIAEQQAANARIQAMHEVVDQMALEQGRQATPPSVSIDAPGIRVSTEGASLILVFEDGLFAGGSRLTEGAKSTLTALAAELEQHLGEIGLVVVGHTDDLPVQPGGRHLDNTSLGMARAVVVVEHMRKTSRLPASLFSVRSRGEHQAPYSNDHPQGRARNRTVVLRITRP